MCYKLAAFLVFQLLFTSVYADEVSQGAATYDWNTCLGDKLGACMNDCRFSHDPDCQSNCKETSQDKCKAEGLSP